MKNDETMALAHTKIEEGTTLEPDERTRYAWKFAVCQPWEENERGRGIRPDGYSLHLSRESRDHYVYKRLTIQHEYFLQTGGKNGQIPDKYSRTSGDWYEVVVDGETIEELIVAMIEHGEHGVRYYKEAPIAFGKMD